MICEDPDNGLLQDSPESHNFFWSKDYRRFLRDRGHSSARVWTGGVVFCSGGLLFGVSSFILIIYYFRKSVRSIFFKNNSIIVKLFCAKMKEHAHGRSYEFAEK